MCSVVCVYVCGVWVCVCVCGFVVWGVGKLEAVCVCGVGVCDVCGVWGVCQTYCLIEPASSVQFPTLPQQLSSPSVGKQKLGETGGSGFFTEPC